MARLDWFRVVSAAFFIALGACVVLSTWIPVLGVVALVVLGLLMTASAVGTVVYNIRKRRWQR